MKKFYRAILIIFAGTLVIGLGGGGQCLSANTDKDPSLHRDGSAFVKEGRITQADRQAAADRAKAKGFVAPKVGKPTEPGKNT